MLCDNSSGIYFTVIWSWPALWSNKVTCVSMGKNSLISQTTAVRIRTCQTGVFFTRPIMRFQKDKRYTLVKLNNVMDEKILLIEPEHHHHICHGLRLAWIHWICLTQLSNDREQTIWINLDLTYLLESREILKNQKHALEEAAERASSICSAVSSNLTAPSGISMSANLLFSSSMIFGATAGSTCLSVVILAPLCIGAAPPVQNYLLHLEVRKPAT